jgi:hypothetical protein
MSSATDHRIPYSVKLLYTAFVAIVVPLYWRTYGPWNFLYDCDIALLITVVAIWLKSPLLVSMQAVAIVVLQTPWVVDLLFLVIGAVEITIPGGLPKCHCAWVKLTSERVKIV